MRYYSSHVDKIDATVTSYRSAEKPTRDNRPLVRTGYEYEYLPKYVVVLYGTAIVALSGAPEGSWLKLAIAAETCDKTAKSLARCSLKTLHQHASNRFNEA